MQKGTFNTKTKYLNTWNDLSMETQQMKIAQWEAKGITIHPNLPLKGPGANIPGLTSKAAQGSADDLLKTGQYTEVKLDTFDNLATDMNSKWHIGTIDKTTYSEKTGTQLFKKVDEELERMSAEFPGIQKVLDHTEPLKQIQLVESGTVSDSAYASYSDQTKIMKIPGKVSKKQSSLKKVGKAGTENGFSSTDSDFYSLFRHEFGHTVDKGLRDAYDAGLMDWNHQDEWRAIFKSYEKKEWSRMFGSYSSTDKYEGFAEAFKVYASPNYKAGMLPHKIEVYMNKALGGGKVKGEAVEKVVKQTKFFKKPSHQKLYDNEFAKYRRLKLTEDQIAREIKQQCPQISKAASSWQGTTQNYEPSALKLKAELLEADPKVKWIASKSGGMAEGASAKRVARMAKDMPEEEYIKLRAITQEYYDRKGIKTVRLSRGTSGDYTGPAFKKKVNAAKEKVSEDQWGTSFVELKEPSLNGWSTNYGTAESFGIGRGGITVTTEIPVKDIILSDELWAKTSHISEREWIILRRTNQKYPLKDIKSRYGVQKRLKVSSTLKQKNKIAFQEWENNLSQNAILYEEDLHGAIEHWIKLNYPDPHGINVVHFGELLDKKWQGIQAAIKNGDPIKMLGKEVKEKQVQKLSDMFANLSDMMDDIVSGDFDYDGWQAAIDEGKIGQLLTDAGYDFKN